MASNTIHHKDFFIVQYLIHRKPHSRSVYPQNTGNRGTGWKRIYMSYAHIADKLRGQRKEVFYDQSNY